MDNKNRVVVLIDMDCFYCQVEEKLNPELKGKPVAVVQYNPWKGGGIIAVNYEARANGVTRHMRGDEAKEKCPEIYLPSVPCLRGKADTSRYREAGKEVAKVLQRFTSLLERASVDEAYLDITVAVEQRINTLDITSISTDMMPNTYALGYDSLQQFINDIHNFGNESIDYDLENSKSLLIGAVIVSEIREAVFTETGYKCSAGIAHNKILAKLVCGMNKPNKQTILPKHSINILYRTLSLKKVKHLGGKFGYHVCSTLGINTMGELQNFTEKQLQAKFEDKNGTWLYNIARGIDSEPVLARFHSKSIGCAKQLRGKSALTDLDSLKNWLKDLSQEIEERLEADSIDTSRVPKQMVVSFTAQFPDGRDVNSSRSHNFTSEDEICPAFISSKALEMILESTELTKYKENEENRRLKTSITFLAISVGKFEDKDDNKKIRKISDFLLADSSKTRIKNTESHKISTEITDKTENACQKINRCKGGKQFLFKMFFQECDKEGESKESTNKNEHFELKKLEKDININESISDVCLQKQELFFQRYLNGKDATSKADNTCNKVNTKILNEDTKQKIEERNKVEHDGSESNSSNYSGSTISDEINKSITLFKDDPFESDRISNMRNMLRSSGSLDDNIETKTRPPSMILDLVDKNEEMCCPDCNKNILIKDFETHADYHLALKLREEDKKEQYIDRVMKTTKNPQSKTIVASKSVSESSSISNFLVKFDNTVPLETCSECKKRIPVHKFAEHCDFHEAQKLSRELNRKPSIPFKDNSKRKRKQVSPDKTQKLPRRTIESFFRNAT